MPQPSPKSDSGCSDIDQDEFSRLATRKVVTYYEETGDDYRRAWYTPADLALHYGFSDETTRSHSDALLNENRFLARIAEIKQSDYILDAGCGVGGSSLWLAENYGARVMGIAISPSQIREAKSNAERKRLAHLAESLEMDFHRMTFPDSTFDVVWMIESSSASPDKSRLLAEAFRILKPGGRLVVADGFQKRETTTKHEQKLLDAFQRGLACYTTTFWDEFGEKLAQAGFRTYGAGTKRERFFHLLRDCTDLGCGSIYTLLSEGGPLSIISRE